MIATIQGRMIQAGDDFIILDVGGIGFKVFVAPAVREQTRLEDRVFLFTHLVVREDSLTLYGFESQEECNYFNLLLGVNGVGPRLSAAIISSLTVDAIRRAVLSEQPDIFARVPGVGKKTAQKIGLYLQGRIKGEGEFDRILESDVDTEVMAALTGLGYSIVEAQAAIQYIPKDTPQDLEERLRQALKFFSV